MKYLIDLDGTILNGASEINDSAKFISELQRMNIDFRIITNSIKSPTLVSNLLFSAGIKVPSEFVFNPITSINTYLTAKQFRRAFIVGSEFEINQVIIGHANFDPQIVILLDFEKENCCYKMLQEVYGFVQKGIPAIAASGSNFYLKGDSKYLDTGAFVNLFQNVANIPIPIFGKPSEDYFKAGINALNSTPDNTTIVGDDWATDISGANKSGCYGVLIKSGKYNIGDEHKCKPVKLISSLLEILN